MGFAVTYLFARRCGDSIRELQGELELYPAKSWINAWVASAYVLKGMDAEAIAACKKFRELEPSVSTTYVCAATYAFVGRKSEAQRKLNEYLNAPHVDPWFVAGIYAGMGDKDKAIEWLSKAYEEHSLNICLLKVDPWFDNLRSGPRFQDLLRRMNFPP